MASPPALLTGFGVAPTASSRRALRAGPYPPGWSRFHDLRGFDRWFLHTYTFPSRLPSPARLAVPNRHGVDGAASRPLLRHQDWAAPCFNDLLRQAESGPFHPTRSVGASWRTERFWYWPVAEFIQMVLDAPPPKSACTSRTSSDVSATCVSEAVKRRSAGRSTRLRRSRGTRGRWGTRP